MVRSRSSGLHGTMVKPQLPITAVVTPSAGEGTQRIPGSLRVEMRMAVDDARHQREPIGGDRARRDRVDARCDADDPAVGDRHVAAPRRAAGAVDDERVAKEQIDHAVFSRGTANSASISRRSL